MFPCFGEKGTVAVLGKDSFWQRFVCPHGGCHISLCRAFLRRRRQRIQIQSKLLGLKNSLRGWRDHKERKMTSETTTSLESSDYKWRWKLGIHYGLQSKSTLRPRTRALAISRAMTLNVMP